MAGEVSLAYDAAGRLTRRRTGNEAVAERWAANQRFLDRLVQRGDEVILTTPVGRATAGSYLAREIQYLLSRGYQIVDEGRRLVPDR